MAAYLLVAQLLVVPVGLGTSAHLVGTGLAALLVGPAVAILCVAVVVVLQALVLADGGVTALGLNLVNDGFVPALVAWGAFCSCARSPRPAGRRPWPGAWPPGWRRWPPRARRRSSSSSGGTDAVSAATVAASIGGAHLLVAGLEAVLTALVLGTVLRLRPDLVRAVRPPRRSAGDGAPTTGDDAGDRHTERAA